MFEPLETHTVLENGIILIETVVYRDQQKQMSVAVYPSEGRNFIKEPYIKVYSGNNSEDTNINIARISLTIPPKYIYHYKNSNYQNNWKLNNKEKNQLNSIMNSPSKRDPRLTNWDQIINILSEHSNPHETYSELYARIKQPDFMELQ